jgi:hypothetical protein
VVATAVYLLNAYFGDRLERKWTQLIGAVVFAGAYWGLYETRGAVSVYVFYSLSLVGATMWPSSMYVYFPQNYPTRMRSPGTGWTDGVAFLGAMGGVLIAGALFTVTDTQPFFVPARAAGTPARYTSPKERSRNSEFKVRRAWTERDWSRRHRGT